MRIGFYSESPADQAALAVFAEGILGVPPEPISMKDLAGRGVGSVFKALDGVYRGVYYNSDAEAFVVVVDCDDTEMHSETHEAGESASQSCRYCTMRKIINRAKNQMRRVVGRPDLKVAIGLAVPSIEAWYLCGKNPGVGEAAWRAGVESGRQPFTRPQLKKLVYGTDRPGLELETERACEEAKRICNDLSRIEAAFPIGFAYMAAEIRTWMRQP